MGTAVATMGMLSSAAYVLAMNNYGPIADNAGGVVEMSRQPEAVRHVTDKLDAAGNVTKAITYVQWQRHALPTAARCWALSHAQPGGPQQGLQHRLRGAGLLPPLWCPHG